MKGNYDELDAEILSLIVNGFTFFGQMIFKVTPIHGCVTYRAVDRRLQALRKKGEISYSRPTGWEVTEDKP